MYPVVYVHKWSHKYLEISIIQSLKNNNKVILIWDEKNLSIAKKYNIDHYSFDEYNTNEFRKYYKHNKPDTPYDYGLIWYERWFVLLEVMKKNNINRCFYIDSDILYYWNVDDEFNRIEKYWNFDLAYPNFSWHSTYIFSQKALEKICEFMLKCYKDEESYKKLLDWPLIYQSWITDMSIFQLYKHYYSDNVFDLTKDYWDHIVYDWFINASEWYKTIFWKKFFKIKNNRAYVYKWNSEIEIKTLHFQMHMKTYMWIVFSKKMFFYYINLCFVYFAEWLFKHFSFVRYLRKKWKERSLFK